jgi:hypothetical protein
MMMMTEIVLETSVSYRHLRRLIAREDFLEFSSRKAEEHISSKLFARF